MTLPLAPLPGEAPGELVWGGERDGYLYYLKHEYPDASWDWTIMFSGRPVGFGIAPDRAGAETELEATLDSLAPPPPPTLAGIVGRLLWGRG